MLKKILRELYLLPRGEQRAVILLSLLLMIAILFRVIVQMLPGRDPPGMKEFEKESRTIIAAIQKEDSLRNLSPFTPHPSPPVTPHQSLATGPVTPHQSPITPVTPHLSPITINTADSVQLLPLPGIGPVFAGRIIKYRNLLGGFTGIDQLYEVYGLKEETIKLISENIVFDRSTLRKISLDSASFRDLLRHPYLQLEDVKALVEYRDFKGSFTSLQELRDNRLLSDSILQKIAPYFLFGK